MKHLPWKILFSAIAIGLAVDILFFKAEDLGINVLLMQLVILGISLLLARHVDKKITLRGWVAAGFALAFASTLAIWTSQLGTIISVFGLLFANFFWILFLLGHSGHIHHPFQVVLEAVEKGAESIFTRLSILGHLKIPGIGRRQSSALRGVLIAIPILLIFLLLFIASDLILQKHTKSFFESLNNMLESGNIVAHFFIIF